VLEVVGVPGPAGVELDDDVDLERLRPLLLLGEDADGADGADAGQLDAIGVDGGPPLSGPGGTSTQLACSRPQCAGSGYSVAA